MYCADDSHQLNNNGLEMGPPFLIKISKPPVSFLRKEAGWSERRYLTKTKQVQLCVYERTNERKYILLTQKIKTVAKFL